MYRPQLSARRRDLDLARWHVVCTPASTMHAPLRTAALAAALVALAAGAGAESQEDGAAVRTGANPPDRGTMGGAGGSFTGAHQLSGTVTAVDQTSGSLSLRSDAGNVLELQFPPPALADVARGDRVTVQLALREDTGRIEEMPGNRGETGRVPGTTPGNGGAAGDR